MFALEIDFHDGISPPETILVRRSSAIIGSSEFAHVVIEGASSSQCELRISRGLGREFRCQPVRKAGQSMGGTSFNEGVYSGEAQILLGDITAHITSLDLDLQVLPDESPDHAGVRVLRSALLNAIPVFPAVAVLGEVPAFLSFPEKHPLLVGRSRKCGLRLNASDVSGEHARVGFEQGRFWVEDLGSTNGTFVGGERVAGRRYLERGETVSVGAEFVLAMVGHAEDVVRITAQSQGGASGSESPETYPCIVSNSDLVRPNRFVFGRSSVVSVGRDPANDIWIGAVHISRRHLEIHRTGAQSVSLLDLSSNGTYVNGERLPSHTLLAVESGSALVDLCSGIFLAICHSREEEERFLLGQPAERPFLLGDEQEDQGGGSESPSELRFDRASEQTGDEQGNSDASDRGAGGKRASRPNMFEALNRKSGGRAANLTEMKRPFVNTGLELKEPGEHDQFTGLADFDYDEQLSEPPVMGRFRLLGLILATMVFVICVLFIFLSSIGNQ